MANQSFTIPVTSFFSKPLNVNRPLHTSIPGLVSPVSTNQIGRFHSLYHRFWKQFKTSSELFSVIDVVVTDILGDRPKFVARDGKMLGRNKNLEAIKFWRDNRMKETLSAILYDELITGDGYGWKGYASTEERTRAVKEVLRKYRLDTKETNKLLIKAIQDEDLKKPKIFDYVSSSTMTINADSIDIINYVQNINGLMAEFSPQEIIHFRYRTMDGRLEGFSPVEALAKEIALLYFVKGNMIAYMENGGRANLLFGMEDSRPGSEAYQRFESALRHFKNLDNSNGNLLASGKVNVTDLSFGKQRDMEYQTLALWATSNIAFSFGVPINRIPYLIGKSASGGDSGGMAEAGYFRNISKEQDKIEDILNSQLFDQLGWNIKLDRGYKQDEVREAQTYSMNADTVSKLQSIYKQQKKKVNINKLNELLNISEDDLEDMTDDDMMMDGKTGMMNQNLLDNMSVQKEPDNRKRASTKRNVANNKLNKDAKV